MTLAHYILEGGAAGKARLDVLASVMQPVTGALLLRAGVMTGDRCVDVGCGGGHVTRELARLVGPSGSALGIDLDAEVIALARNDADLAGLQNIAFHIGEATSIPEGRYDVAFARFLLSHVPDPGAVLSAMVNSLAPGGLVILEDTDFACGLCYPQCSAYDRLCELVRETVRRRGGNAEIGPALPSLIRQAGIAQVALGVSQPAALTGEVKFLMQLTLERIRDSILEERLATPPALERLHAELRGYCEDPTTLMGVPRVIQVWGRKRPSDPQARTAADACTPPPNYPVEGAIA
jgi:SAM-dependent methyltransferase